MLQQDDGVVLGVSGGADSVCLLFLLLAIREKWKLRLHVVHVNHGIRQEAGEDAAYVEELCCRHEIPFYLYEADILTLAEEWHCSTEEAGRTFRYEAFREVLEKQNCQKIAVAHNANDRAETMLFHLFRGTGLTGLTGIRPTHEQIIRPILCLQRWEIEAYLNEKKIDFKHDCTNDGDEYTRNKIRHHILPFAEQEIVQGSVTNMVRAADILAETENYIEEQLAQFRMKCVEESFTVDRGFCIDRGAFLQEHVFLQKRLLLLLLKELSPGHKNIASVHVEDVQSLFVLEGNREIHLPYQIRASRQYGKIILERQGSPLPDNGFEDVLLSRIELSRGECVISIGLERRFYFKLIDCSKESVNFEDIPQNQYTKWFDYDKIKGCLMLRTRRTSDYLSVRNGKALGHKKLKDYMISEKISKTVRDVIPLLADENHVLWVVGYRISEYYKVDESTKCILQVSVKNL